MTTFNNLPYIFVSLVGLVFPALEIANYKFSKSS